ncbi:MAG: hypothetical protein J6Q52_06445 [Clostridia bacterium]|nr:hypothetical protein [Clostridia bacterium]
MERLPRFIRIPILIVIALYFSTKISIFADDAGAYFLLFVPLLVINIIGFTPGGMSTEICVFFMCVTPLYTGESYPSEMGSALIVAEALIAMLTMVYNAFYLTLCDEDGPFLFWYDMLCYAILAICGIVGVVGGPLGYIVYALYGLIPCIVLYILKTRVIDRWGGGEYSSDAYSSEGGGGSSAGSRGYAPQYIVDEAISDAQRSHSLVTVIRTEYHPTHVVVHISIPAGYYQMPSEFANTIHSRISSKGYTFGVEIKSKYD